jgi:hypothetical protein
LQTYTDLHKIKTWTKKLIPLHYHWKYNLLLAYVGIVFFFGYISLTEVHTKPRLKKNPSEGTKWMASTQSFLVLCTRTLIQHWQNHGQTKILDSGSKSNKTSFIKRYQNL